MDLPASIKCHPAFHISLQQPATNNLLVGKKQPAPAPIFVDDHIEFQVEKIVDLKVVCKNLKYLVRWVGYDELTWEPAELLWNSCELVHYFHRMYETKLKPNYLPQLWPNLRYLYLDHKTVPLSSVTWRTNLWIPGSSPLKRGLQLWTLPCHHLTPYCYHSEDT